MSNRRKETSTGLAVNDGPDATAYVIVFKRVLLLIWAVWFSVAWLSNAADAAKGLGWIPDSWTFASGNLQFIRETTARYGTPDVVNGMLFAGVIVWEGIATLLFWWAGWTFRGRGTGRAAVYWAFSASLLLWGGFLAADEIFIAYPLESTHLHLFIGQLMTLLAIELLPE